MPAVLAFIMGVCVMGLAAAVWTNRLHDQLEQERARSRAAAGSPEVVDFAAAVPGQLAHTWEIDDVDFDDYKFETGGDPRDLYGYIEGDDDLVPVIRKTWRLVERTELVARPSRPLATPVAPFAEWAGQPQTYAGESMRVGE